MVQSRFVQQKPQMPNIKLNLKYLGDLANLPRVVTFVVNLRARRIQAAYREHFELRIFAANFIRKAWKVYKRTKGQREYRKEQFAFVRKRAAINQIYRFSKLIKVRKVTA